MLITFCKLNTKQTKNEMRIKRLVMLKTLGHILAVPGSTSSMNTCRVTTLLFGYRREY